MPKNERIFTVNWDFDGVLANSYLSVLHSANLRLSLNNYSKQITPQELNAHDSLFHTVFHETGDYNLAKEIRNYWFDSRVLALSPANEAMLSVFRKLEEFPDIRQIINTTRPNKNRFCTQNSLKDYFPELNLTNRLFMRNPLETISGSESKSRFWFESDVDYIIEDGTTDLQNFQKLFPYQKYAAIIRPWNADIFIPADRSFSPDSTKEIIEDILKAKDEKFSSLPSIRISKPRLST